MDLGLSSSADLFASGSFSPEEISALINPTGARVQNTPSAIQVLLNQGAEYLAQKNPFELEHLMQSFGTFFKTKSDKVQSISSVLGDQLSFQNPLVCSFDIGATDRGMIAFDWRLSYVLIDALLGGINGVSIEKKQDEPYSAIEKNVLMPVICQLLDLVAEDRGVVTKPVGLSSSLPVKEISHSRFVFFVRTPVLSGKMCLDLPTHLVPKSQSGPLIFADDLVDVPVVAQAVISNLQTSVAEVSQWQVGTQLMLGAANQLQIDLSVGNKTVAQVEMQTDTPERRVCVEAV